MEPHKGLAYPKPVLLLGRSQRCVGEDSFAEVVVVLIELLDGIEVAVDHHVEEPVEQEAHAVLGKVW